MRIHFPNHPAPLPDAYADTPRDLAIRALDECKQNGTVAPHVGFKVLTTHQRRGTGSALEIQLEAYERDRGRRYGNSGSYGGGENYTATYDEWGFFLAALYRLAGEDMQCGTGKYAQYRDAEDFHEKTGRTYDPTYVDYVGQYGDDFMYRSGRNQIGRRGAGRVHYDNPETRWAKEDPRTSEYLRDLHAGRIF